MTTTNHGSGHDYLIAAADAEVKKAEEFASKNPYRLNYHIMAPANWINDPNGLIQFNGEYHIFYQHHPFGVEWGPMHWGHVKSSDLVYWEYQPIALAPSEPYDDGGCFSGSAIEHNGLMYLYYTGVVYVGGVNRQNRHNRKEVQCMATSQDGIAFVKHSANPILPNPPTDGSKDFRDPKVWKHSDRWYMIVGSTKDLVGKVVLYESSDLVEWNYKGVVAESDGTQGYMWECPDLFPLGNKHVLIVSPMGMERRKTIYFIGEMNYETGLFFAESTGEMDHGFDFYAAQTMEDQQGRRIMVGWMDCWDVAMPSQQGGWAGALTIPRLLTLDSKGKLKIKPVKELDLLRREHRQFNELLISPDSTELLKGVQGDSLEIVADFDLMACEASEFGIKLRVSEDGKEETLIFYDRLKKQVVFDRTKSDNTENSGISAAPVEIREGETLKLHIFLDRSSVEVFINQGHSVISNRIYSSQDSQGVELFAKDGAVKLRSLEVWNLDSACK
jgi:beta-fructofuranosidase